MVLSIWLLLANSEESAPQSGASSSVEGAWTPAAQAVAATAAAPAPSSPVSATLLAGRSAAAELGDAGPVANSTGPATPSPTVTLAATQAESSAEMEHRVHPTHTPTTTPTKTRVPTRTPISTNTPAATPTASPSPTPTRTPLPAAVATTSNQVATPPPPDNDMMAGPRSAVILAPGDNHRSNSPTLFIWQADTDLGPGQEFEVVFWRANGESEAEAKGLVRSSPSAEMFLQ
ncbi:MAG: hypothetical protein IAE81_02440, partial [Caldilineaceae bacterium]|nr:hypothetical protein [Caldilineaceae bacterium]